MPTTKKMKIAFLAATCFVGGVETALLNLLKSIDRNRYEITLFTNFDGNPCVKELFPEIHYKNLDTSGLKPAFFSALSHFKVFRALDILKNYAILKLSSEWYIQDIYSCKHMNFKSQQFDVVIAYKHAWSTTYIAKNAIAADKSVMWVHSTLPSENTGYLQTLCSYDKCFCVSEYIQSYFLQHCPSMKGKTEVFHNILNAEAIIKKAQEPINDIDTDRKCVLVTVGRLGQDKGQTVIPKTARLLADSGIDFVWYLVGDGPTRGVVEQEIKAHNVEECVYLLGTKENPYPYIKACTIYVQTSTSEGWCLTTQEARILRKPCVVTDIPVMHEQFADGENGIIANGTDAVSLYNGIMRLIKSPDLCNRIIKNLESTPQDGVMELNKLYDFLDE